MSRIKGASLFATAAMLTITIAMPATPGSTLAQTVLAQTVLAQTVLAQTVPAVTAFVANPDLEPEYQASWNDYLAMKSKAKSTRLPDWSGIWQRTGFVPGPSIAFGEMSPQDIGSLLTPKYKADFEKKKARVAANLEWDRLSACLPAGMPRWLTEPFLREFIPTPKVTWLIHEQISEVRRIYTDRQTHEGRGELGPLWEGDSIGFWDEGTLVIHTIRMKAGEYQRGHPNFSFKLSTLERMRSVGPNTVEDVVTVYDPGSLVRPFTTRLLYERKKEPAPRVQFASCEEGNNAVRAADGATTFVLPGEPGYKDPLTYGVPEVAMDSLPQ